MSVAKITSEGANNAEQSRNLQNALKSTGPRSNHGKSRASRNALKHGLARASPSIPEDAIEIVARAIVGGTCCDPEVNALARRLAVAQAQVNRVQAVRDSYASAFFQALDSCDTGAMARLLVRLHLLERYERTALAQRRFAIRDFAAASAATSRSRRTEGRIFTKRSQIPVENQC